MDSFAVVFEISRHLIETLCQKIEQNIVILTFYYHSSTISLILVRNLTEFGSIFNTCVNIILIYHYFLLIDSLKIIFSLIQPAKMNILSFSTFQYIGTWTLSIILVSVTDTRYIDSNLTRSAISSNSNGTEAFFKDINSTFGSFQFLLKEVNVVESLLCNESQYSRKKFSELSELQLTIFVQVFNDAYGVADLFQMISACQEIAAQDRNRVSLVVQSFKDFDDRNRSSKYTKDKQQRDCSLGFHRLLETICRRKDVLHHK